MIMFSVISMAENAANGQTPGEVLRDLGLIEGVGEGDLNEQGVLTRESMVTMLVRMSTDLEDDFEPPLDPTFKDVPVDHWAYRDIERAYSLGITNGIGGGLFGLGKTVTYQESLAFLLKTLGKTIEWDQVITYSETELYMYSTEGAQSDQLLRCHIFDLTIIALNTATEDGTLLVNKTDRFDKDKVYNFRGEASNRYLDKKNAKSSELVTESIEPLNDSTITDPLEIRELLSQNLDVFDFSDFEGVPMTPSQRVYFKMYSNMSFDEITNDEFADLLKGMNSFTYANQYHNSDENTVYTEWMHVPQTVEEDGSLIVYGGTREGISVDVFKKVRFYIQDKIFMITYIVEGRFDREDPSIITPVKGIIVGHLGEDNSVIKVTNYSWNRLGTSDPE